MDQILQTLVQRLSRVDWLDIVLVAVTLVICLTFAERVERRTGSRLAAATAAVFLMLAIAFGPVRYGEPLLRGWLDGGPDEANAALAVDPPLAQAVQAIPLFALLMERHPEARAPLLRAARKSAAGDKDAIVGQIEMGAIVSHYLRRYFPTTSDRAAMQFAWAATAIVDQMAQRDPALCVAVLKGDTRAMSGRLPPQVFVRFTDAVGDVIADAIAAPQAAPDRADIQWKRERVKRRMTTDGNPLMKSRERLMTDPKRACVALLAIVDAVSKSVPQNEVGAFLRGTIPEFLKDDEV